MWDLFSSVSDPRVRTHRRDFLRVGSLIAGGLSLPELLRYRHENAQASPHSRTDTAVIQIFLGGGPSHLDMFDLKPHAPAEIRGEFNEIATSVPGVRICEHLPRLASVMDRFAVVRSMSHGNASHLPASHWLQTGYAVPDPVPGHNANPSTGSIAARLRGPNVAGMPAYVAVPRGQAFSYAAYLGAAFDPFATQVEPKDPQFQVPNLTLTRQITRQRVSSRRQLLTELDHLKRDMETHGELAGIDSFRRDAFDMITNERTARAFAIEQESDATRARYGDSSIGQNCLLARRLVESGVTFVACLSGGGWDTHTNNFADLKQITLPRLDQALSALLRDLQERGLDQRVLVNVMGEFGRTPQINKDAGRDHWPGAGFALFAGGGLQTGAMVGETDRLAAYPISQPFTPGDVLATIYHVLGIDPRQTFYDSSRRPIPVLPEGHAIRELIA